MIRRVAVLGAGTMGHGIAHAAIAAGCETRLFDVDHAALIRAQAAVGEILDKAVALGKLSSAEVASTVARLSTASRLETALADVDLVIEAAPERLDLKLRLLPTSIASPRRPRSWPRIPRPSASPRSRRR